MTNLKVFELFISEAISDRADDRAGGGRAPAAVPAAQDGGRAVPDARPPRLPQDNHQAGRFIV